MDTRHVPDHLHDPANPPPTLTGASLTHWHNNAMKALENYHLQREFPSFYIPLPCYNVVHIHRFADAHILDITIQHYRSCRAYSMDTESYGCSSNVTLIQIHTIPSTLPSYVLLVQLCHLPPFDSVLFGKIQLIFQILFGVNNILYSWGDLEKELSHALRYSLFSFPIEARCINLQLEFRKWFTQAPPFCEVCKPYDTYHLTRGSSRFCQCKDHPYTRPSTLWSLQKAIIYSTSCSLDKSQTRSPWHQLLDPRHTTLPLDKTKRMIYYAVYDCLSVTYLHYPITQCWSLIKLEKTSIACLLTDSPISHMDLVYISDDEIAPPIQAMDITDEVSPTTVASSHSPHPNLPSIVSKHSQRSNGARRRRNKKRNLVHRSHRYKHYLIRVCHHRFRMKQIKAILHEFNMQDTHVKRDNNRLIIGVKSEVARQQYHQTLPVIFSYEKTIIVEIRISRDK